MSTKAKQRDPVSNAVRSAAGAVRFNGRLNLADTLKGLVQDGLITEKEGLAVRAQVSGENRVDIHPIVRLLACHTTLGVGVKVAVPIET